MHCPVCDCIVLHCVDVIVPFHHIAYCNAFYCVVLQIIIHCIVLYCKLFTLFIVIGYRPSAFYCAVVYIAMYWYYCTVRIINSNALKYSVSCNALYCSLLVLYFPESY